MPVRADFAESHDRFWRRLARPGAWWTGAERVAIAREARAAESCAHCQRRQAALSPHTVADGLSDGHYVELVGTVVALSLPPHPLPVAEPGAPTRYRPASAGPDEAWVPMVPLDKADTPEADLWPAERTGNVIRALSLVPDEVRTLADLSAVHYLENTCVRDPAATQGSLSRPQMELLAGPVSALNQCIH